MRTTKNNLEKRFGLIGYSTSGNSNNVMEEKLNDFPQITRNANVCKNKHERVN